MSQTHSEADTSYTVDAILVGGGIAGLWLLNRLTAMGQNCVLFSSGPLGEGQTLASQGMLHGGMKYSLAGSITRATEAIATMPNRWRSAMKGAGDIDLRGVQLLAPHYYLWSGDRRAGKIATVAASRLLRGSMARLSRQHFPTLLRTPAFRGTVYQANDPILDPVSLVNVLAAPHRSRIFQHKVRGADIQVNATDGFQAIALPGGQSISARRLILCAGTGNEALLDYLRPTLPELPRAQRRPLHQVVVRHQAETSTRAQVEQGYTLFGHCLNDLTRPEPRITVTTHQVTTSATAQESLWYLGGSLASDGAERSQEEQIAAAQKELALALPWLTFAKSQFETYRIDRAEMAQPGGLRPDEASVAVTRNVIVGWPTKLTLAPDLGDQVCKLFERRSAPTAAAPVLPLPLAETGMPLFMHGASPDHR